MRRFATWMFSGRVPPVPASRVIAWWELRRIPFNLIVGAYAAACLAVFLWAITTSGHLEPGEDAVEPITLLAAPIGINILYTLGWLVEVPLRWLRPSLSSRFGPLLLKLGLGLCLLLITIPPAFWGGRRLCQLAGIAHSVARRWLARPADGSDWEMPRCFMCGLAPLSH